MVWTLPVHALVCSAQLGLSTDGQPLSAELQGPGTTSQRVRGEFVFCWQIGQIWEGLHCTPSRSSRFSTSVDCLPLLGMESGAGWTFSVTQQSGSCTPEIVLAHLHIGLPYL